MHALIAGLPGGAEWIILLVVALLLFGGSRLAGIGKGTGRAIREFKDETRGLKATESISAVENPPQRAPGNDVRRSEDAADVVDTQKKID